MSLLNSGGTSFDALRVKIRDEGLVRNKAVYLAIGITCGGDKDVLGLWIEQTEGAKFWLRVMNELKARGTQDLLIAVVDGLKGFPEAITTVFPDCGACKEFCVYEPYHELLDWRQIWRGNTTMGFCASCWMS